MKGAVLVFCAVLVCSFAFMCAEAFIFGGDASFLSLVKDTPTAADKQKFRRASGYFAERLSDFDENFFVRITGGGADADAGMESAVKAVQKIPEEGFSSGILPGLLIRASGYYGGGMEAKAVLSAAEDNMAAAAFLSAYDAVEYDYAAAEAMMRIAGRFVKISEDRVFMPDVVSEKILSTGSCSFNDENAESYEKVLRWYVGFSALKASFDAEYLKMLFGKSFYSKKEIRDTLYRMKRLLAALDGCRPPEFLGNGSLTGYDFALYSYIKKMELSEYYGLAPFPDKRFVNAMVKNVYSYGNMSEVIAESVGYESFKTLGMLAVFELYSKN